MRRTQQANHGAALESRPLRERWEMTPVPMRADIAAHGRKVSNRYIDDLRGIDLVDYAIQKLSLENASFGSAETDSLVKSKVSLHHLSWIMKPLMRLYDQLGKGVVA